MTANTMPTLDPAFRLLGRQDWLRFGIRDRLIRRYCDPDRTPSIRFEDSFFGLRYAGDLSSYLDWCVYFYGAYEKQTLHLFDDIVRTVENPVALDIGANIGHHSLFLARRCAAVHAFEPNPVVRRRIAEKVELNRLTNLHIHAVGLGAEDADLPFYAPGGANQGTGSFVAGYSANNQPAGVLRVEQADRFIKRLAPSKVTLIKIDVEGFEKSVLVGLSATLATYRPHVVMEFSTATRRSFRDMAELMAMFPPGFVVRRIESERPIFVLFNAPSYRLQAFDFDSGSCDLLVCPAESELLKR